MSLVGSGVIGPGNAEFFDVVLRGQHLYQIDVHPSEPGVDFDLQVFDENGNLINEDLSESADAYAAIVPRWTGPFRLVVSAARGASAYRIEVRD
jgi:hypothetical protein